jgi:cysteinyl-tRNA synthetase
MEKKLYVYNSLKKEKELFVPQNEGYVGMYVCGPTVYSDVHLGNCRTFTSFDVIFRFLKYLGYKVRYVRNITDVGHLLDDGEDRILKGARLEQIEPMEVVQKYANGFHHIMSILNTERPSIEPRATGHIIEQIEMVQKIIDNGFAYEINGSVYFDTIKFAQETGVYGQLSGRVIDDLLSETRDNLKKQDEKKHPSDFAIWMKAAPEHIMKWNSPWSEGFPGWHLECSAMSTKYLGQTFDIHGGGNDLKFPHHENEIAQNVGACSCSPARYWLHTNMLLLNGKKMSKSDGNTISPQQLFSGENDIMTKAYSPMVVKFFMLQSHYRSTLDLTDDALQAAEKGYRRLMEGYRTLHQLEGAKGKLDSGIDQEITKILDMILTDMCDDFNTPKALAGLFELVTKINALKSGNLPIHELSATTFQRACELMHNFIFQVFGLTDETSTAQDGGPIDGLMELILELRKEARENKDWSTADKIRDRLKALEIQIKDGKEGTTWSLN